MTNNKLIVEYILWLLIALVLGLAIVWLETTLYLKGINFFTGFVVGVFRGLRKLLVLYLGSVIGLSLYLVFIPIYVKIIKKKIETKGKQRLIGFFTMLVLVVLLKIIHSVLVYKFNLI